MGIDPKSAKASLITSRQEGSSFPSEVYQAQLSPSARVESDVSSVAFDRGALVTASATTSRPVGAQCIVSGEALTDAEVMLKVKAGDEAAFNYLVQKYRRPILSFMYRLAHNSGAAE